MNAGLRVAATGAILLMLCACGGSGSASSTPSTTKPASSGKVSVTLRYPTNVHYAKVAPSAVARAPLYVNPTPGAVITVTNNGVTVVSDTFVNPQPDGTQTIEIPVVGGVGTGEQNNIVVSEYAQSNPDTTLLSQGSTTIYLAAGDDQSYTLAMNMNVVGAAITLVASYQGTVLSTNSGSPTATVIAVCGTEPFFVYAVDPTNAFVTSAYTGIPQVTISSQTGSPAGSFVTALPTGGFQVTTASGVVGDDVVTFAVTNPLYGNTILTYADFGANCT